MPQSLALVTQERDRRPGIVLALVLLAIPTAGLAGLLVGVVAQ
ncbi:hypothetical protein [Micromonospora sp. NPDC005652]